MWYNNGVEKKKEGNPMSTNLKYLITDTETANSLEDPLVYNFAGRVIDAHGNVYEEASFLNMDVYRDKTLMTSAYYASKIPLYEEQLRNGEITPASWYQIGRWVREVCKRWNVVAIIAHNARFDYRSCSATQRWETSSKFRYFFPYGVEIWDTMRMAREIIAKQEKYVRFCEENNFMTNHKIPRPRVTAEVLYRFIANDLEFEEQHRALEDTKIESEIFWYCMKRRCKKEHRYCFKRG